MIVSIREFKAEMSIYLCRFICLTSINRRKLFTLERSEKLRNINNTITDSISKKTEVWSKQQHSEFRRRALFWEIRVCECSNEN